MGTDRLTIGVLTGGGDCQGLNAAIRAVAKTVIVKYKGDVLGICDGYQGFIEEKTVALDYESVSGILDKGGTILGTNNRADPFRYIWYKDGKKTVTDESATVIENAGKWGLDGVVVIGGDGTMTITEKLYNRGLKAVGVPKTIDNDLMGTDRTIGFQSAVNIVTDAVDALHSTAEAHHRVMIVEVMGRYAGWIALYGGIAGGGDIILIPEIPFKLENIYSEVTRRNRIGKRFSIIVVAEGAVLEDGRLVVDETIGDSPDPIRLGGIGRFLKEKIESSTGLETREVVLGHLQRGGPPSSFDRILATQMGYHAVELILEQSFGKLVCLNGAKVCSIPLAQAAKGVRTVPVDHPLIEAARALGTRFGD